MAKHIKLILLFTLMISLASLFENCSRIRFQSDPAATHQAQLSGNGQGYDGMVTYMNATHGFFCVGQAINTLVPKTSLAVDRYSISPPLPAGLSFDPATGQITGTPTTPDILTAYTVTAHAGGQTYSTTIHFLVGQTIAVNSTADLPNSSQAGSVCQAADGTCTLRAAIESSNASQDPSCIMMPAGIYSLTTKAILNVTQNVALIGAGQNTTIIDGTGTGNGIMNIVAQSFSASHLTIENGSDAQTSGFGAGGVTIKTATSASFDHCTFANNRLTAASGINLGAGALFLNDCQGPVDLTNDHFLNNSEVSPLGDMAGAIAAAFNGMININSCRFDGNSSVSNFGGDVFLDGVYGLTVTSSNFNNGSGISLYIEYMPEPVPVQIVGSTFENNKSGALYVYNITPPLHIVNSTISNNAGFGLSIINLGGGTPANQVTLQNDTLSDNAVDLAFQGAPPASGSSIVNTILSSTTTGKNCSSSLANIPGLGISYSLFSDTTCSASGTGVVSGDPLLQPLANNGGATDTRVPAGTSPVIDVGSNALCPNTDQRGASRPVDKLGKGAVCDIGAVEVQ